MWITVEQASEIRLPDGRSCVPEPGTYEVTDKIVAKAIIDEKIGRKAKADEIPNTEEK